MEIIIQNLSKFRDYKLNSESDCELTRVELHHTITALVQLWHLCLQRWCTSGFLKPHIYQQMLCSAKGAGCKRTDCSSVLQGKSYLSFKPASLSLELVPYSEQMNAF